MLFDLVDYPATPAPHACGGPYCQVCALTRTGAEAKDKGTKKVSRDEGWWAEAAHWLNERDLYSTFTADDLVADIYLPEGSPNQVGACIRAWAASDRIRPSGYKAANRKSSHGRVLRVWQVIA